MPITERQKEILKRIIKEFMASAQAVGSVTLSEKHDLGVSPATLRAEMTRLVEQGYLYKPHLSSGRIPTTLGMRYFLEDILKEERLDSLFEARIKEKLFQRRFQRSRILKEATNILSRVTGQTALSLIDEVVFSSGISHLVSNPEFEDYEILQSVLDIIESESLLSEIFEKYINEKPVVTLIGDEIGLDSMNECSIVYSTFKFFRGEKGYIAVVGPRRMRYSRVIPSVRAVSDMIEESIRGWE